MSITTSGCAYELAGVERTEGMVAPPFARCIQNVSYSGNMTTIGLLRINQRACFIGIYLFFSRKKMLVSFSGNVKTRWTASCDAELSSPRLAAKQQFLIVYHNCKYQA